VTLARDLHGIRKIIVIDHRDCGACKAFVGITCADERAGETAIHQAWMTALAHEINQREPDLDVELLLMDLDGSVEAITAQPFAKATASGS
jgi:carbonic anhydrase